MRLQTFLVPTLTILLFQAGLAPFAAAEEPGEKIVYGKYDNNELAVDKMDGTIMVQHHGEAKPFALQTLSTVEKGDIVTVYDGSWVIFKDHRGDRIGLDSNTTVAVNDFYIAGPSRDIIFLLQKGSMILKTSNVDSKQSFFEVDTGSVVTSINGVEAILTYYPDENEHLEVQYFRGKLKVIDKSNEYKFGEMPKVGSNIKNLRDKGETPDINDKQLDYIPQWSELNWENGVLLDKQPTTVEEIVNVNYKRFFDGEDPLEAVGNNILLGDSILMAELRAHGVGGAGIKEANTDYQRGLKAYREGRFSEAKDWYEQALAAQPSYHNAQSALQRLAQEHPELQIDESDWKFEKQPAKNP